jgi:hypothetical protein
MTVRFTADLLLKETEKAFLVTYRGASIWLPKFQVESWVIEDDGVDFAISDWIAEKKGISDEPRAERVRVRRYEKPPPFKPEPARANPSVHVAPELDIDTGGQVTPKKTVRVFLAHSKSDAEGSIAAMKSMLISVLTRAAAGTANVLVVTGRDDYEENFKRCGSWDAWAMDVVDRIDFATRDRVYKALAVTSVYVGSATAKMIERALAVGTRLMLINGFELQAIVGIEKVADDFKAGWRVRT